VFSVRIMPSIFDRLGEAALCLLEIDNVPNSLQIIWLDVLVLQVECMFPNVNTNDGDMREQGILVCSGDNFKLAGGLVESKPPPATALDGGGLGVHSLLELLHGAEVADNSVLEVALFKGTSAGGTRSKVLPEQRVVDVSSTVELESSLQRDLRCDRVRLGVLLLGVVQTGHIGLMMLRMVEGHDLLRDVRLQSVVGIRQLRQCVK